MAQVKHPADAPLGEYQVYCYAVKEGQGGASVPGKISGKTDRIGLSGLPIKPAKNAVVYGIMAAPYRRGTGIGRGWF